MRVIALLTLCIGLAGCAEGVSFAGLPAADASASSAPIGPTPPPNAAAGNPATVHATGGGGARGGASTAARSAAPDPDGPTPTEDPLIQARADCWMKTEKAKLRDIDARAAFVAKCVSDAMKNGPKS
jgi:hypothetical protein